MGRGHKAMLKATRLREAKYENMKKEPPPRTWSARMPAYCYTELCVVPDLRRYPADESRTHLGNI